MSDAGALPLCDRGNGVGTSVSYAVHPSLPPHHLCPQAKYVVLLAPLEAEKGLVRVKCLESGEQVDVPFEEVASVAR